MPIKSQLQPRDFITRGAEHWGVRRALGARGELPEVLSVVCDEVDLRESQRGRDTTESAHAFCLVWMALGSCGSLAVKIIWVWETS